MIKGRFFLVGCPRSGTTLLQAMLAAHPQIMSFPESFLFSYLVPSKPWLRTIGIASRHSRPRFKKFVTEIKRPELRYYLRYCLTMRQHVKGFVKVFDQLALENRKEYWLEKTPSHIKRIKEIEHYVENVKFIHLIRNGNDVVASLYDAALKYPESCWKSFNSIDECIRKWIVDLKISLKYKDQTNHLLIRYENLVDNPEKTISEICFFLGVSFDFCMLEDYKNLTKNLVYSREKWKNNTAKNLSKISKFQKVFSKQQQQYVELKIQSTKELVRNF